MPTTLVPERELAAIARAYDESPGNAEYRFRHFFANVVGVGPESAHLKARPAGVDELTWRGLLDEVGGEHNALGLWPVPGDGFKTLAERARVQEAELASERAYLDAVAARVAEIRRFRGARLAERVAQVSRTQAEQQHRLLRLMRVVEAAEGRRYEAQARGGGGDDGYADGYAGRPVARRGVGGMSDEERALASRLRRLQGALSRSTTSLPRRVDALAAAHRAEKAADAQASLGRAAGAAAAAAARAKKARARDAPGAGANAYLVSASKENAVGVAFAEKPPLGSAAARSGRPESDARRDVPGFPGTRSRHGARHGSRADEATAAAYGALVAEQAEATRRLAEILKKDLRDLAVLRRENASGAAAETAPQHVPYY
jgi:nuclear pore complex protein Nup54